MERVCNKCLWATRDGECASWECEFVDKRKAYDMMNGRIGKWISHKHRGLIDYSYECSLCGGIHAVAYTYCPDCGAKMEE